MRKILPWFLALIASVAFAQTHEQTLSTLGMPMPPSSVFCNSLLVNAPASICVAGTGISIQNGVITASSSGTANPAGLAFSVQYNLNGSLGGTGPGTSGQCLISNGSNSAPTFQNCTASGAVSSVTAGTSNLLNITPTTGTVVADIANLGGYTFIGNPTASTAAPVAATMQNVAAAWVAVNETSLTVTPGAGPVADYNPAGWGSTVAYLHVNPAAGNSVLRGLVAGSSMQTVIIDNSEATGSGTDFVVLNDEDATDTTAANRFHATGNLYIPSGGYALCTYTTVLNRWLCR